MGWLHSERPISFLNLRITVGSRDILTILVDAENRYSIRKNISGRFLRVRHLNAICVPPPSRPIRAWAHMYCKCSIRNGIKHATNFLLLLPFHNLLLDAYFPQIFHAIYRFMFRLHSRLPGSKKSLLRFNLLIANEN